MKTDMEKLNKIAVPVSQKELDKMTYMAENKEWFIQSGRIAIGVRRLLRERKMTQEKFAELLGKSPAQVTKLLSGKSNLTLKTIQQMGKALGEDLFKLMGDKPAMRFYNIISGEIPALTPVSFTTKALIEIEFTDKTLVA